MRCTMRPKSTFSLRSFARADRQPHWMEESQTVRSASAWTPESKMGSMTARRIA